MPLILLLGYAAVAHSGVIALCSGAGRAAARPALWPLILELLPHQPPALPLPRLVSPLRIPLAAVPFPTSLSRSPSFCSFPSPQLLLGVEIAFQLPFAFPINPDSAIKSAGGAGREAVAGTGPLGAVASAPLPFRPRLLPAPPCAAGQGGNGTPQLLRVVRLEGWGRLGSWAGERWPRGVGAGAATSSLPRPHPELTPTTWAECHYYCLSSAHLPLPRGGPGEGRGEFQVKSFPPHQHP